MNLARVTDQDVASDEGWASSRRFLFASSCDVLARFFLVASLARPLVTRVMFLLVIWHALSNNTQHCDSFMFLLWVLSHGRLALCFVFLMRAWCRHVPVHMGVMACPKLIIANSIAILLFFVGTFPRTTTFRMQICICVALDKYCWYICVYYTRMVYLYRLLLVNLDFKKNNNFGIEEYGWKTHTVFWGGRTGAPQDPTISDS